MNVISDFISEFLACKAKMLQKISVLGLSGASCVSSFPGVLFQFGYFVINYQQVKH